MLILFVKIEKIKLNLQINLSLRGYNKVLTKVIIC